MRAVLTRVLAKVKPSAKEFSITANRVSHVVSVLKSNLKKNGIEAEVFVGGSIAKNTYLRNVNDADIFVRFPLRARGISSLTLAACKTFKPEIVHGSRDYYCFSYKGLGFEVVPVYKINKADEARNIMDCSPLHVDYVKKHLRKHDDVRFLKYLCKMNHFYGAESHISGFSGYVLELLVIYYGSFWNVLKATRSWVKGEIIDVAKHYKKPELVRKTLSKSKLTSLIVIDPTQKTRNASTALSHKSFTKMKSVSNGFLENPSEEFFKDKKTLKNLRASTSEKGFFLASKKLNVRGREDIFLSKLDKSLRKIRKELVSNDFSVDDHGFILRNGRVLVYFIFKHRYLPPIERLIGPPKNMEEHVKRFKNKWKNESLRGPYYYTGRVAFDVERKCIDAKQAFDKVIKKL